MSETTLNLVVHYFSEGKEGNLPYSVVVKGDREAKQLPRDHPYWTLWGIDVLEAAGSIHPHDYFDPQPPAKTEGEIAIENREIAKVIRDGAIEAEIIVYGVSWQVDIVKDEPRIRRAIDTAKIEGYPVDHLQNWILTDNSIRPTTRAELEHVLVAKALREKLIFEQYATWVYGGMQKPFVVDEEALNVPS